MQTDIKEINRFDDIETLDFVSQKTAEEFKMREIETVNDLLMLPVRTYENKKDIINFSSVDVKGEVNTFVRVLSKAPIPGRNAPKVLVEDIADRNFPSGSKIRMATLWCYGRPYLNWQLVPGNTYYLHGSAVRKKEYANALSLSDFTIRAAHVSENEFSAKNFGNIVSVYTADYRLNTKIKNTVTLVLNHFAWDKNNFGVSDDFLSKNGLCSVREAFFKHHLPETAEDAETARRTLALIEIARFRAAKTQDRAYKDVLLSEKEKQFVSSLPFRLTDAQSDAVKQILSDLEQDCSAERLLQGEVGSGKTITAFIAVYHEMLGGRQSVLMAPTEILAFQHYINAQKYFKDTALRIGFVSSSLTAAERRKIIAGCRSGEIDFLIGTHSLISADFEFKSLSFAVVDEEQRFGTEQKEKVQRKGKNVKILYMSATPIPRSILKIFSGNLECTTLESVPSGRVQVKTFLVSQERRHEAYNCIKGEFSKGHCAYFVVPRIDDEKMEHKSISNLEKELASIFPGVPYAAVSSRMKDKDKEKILRQFLAGEIKYLIATSVVEVGMDNKNATVMVIEDADMFGLSTLHQLRGRVGRSSLPSWCFLVYRDEISDSGKERLRTIKDSDNGFEIAEKDLTHRGGGDVVGIKQSGRTSLKYFDYDKDQDLLSLF